MRWTPVYQPSCLGLMQYDVSQPAPSIQGGTTANPRQGRPQLLAIGQETRRCRACGRTLPVSHFRGLRKPLVQNCQECRSRMRAQQQRSALATEGISAIAGGRYETALPQAPQAPVETPVPAQHATPESAESLPNLRHRLTSGSPARFDSPARYGGNHTQQLWHLLAIAA